MKIDLHERCGIDRRSARKLELVERLFRVYLVKALSWIRALIEPCGSSFSDQFGQAQTTMELAFEVRQQN